MLFTPRHVSVTQLRPRHAIPLAIGGLLILLYFFESTCRVLPESWTRTDAYKAVIGMADDEERVPVWRETRYLGGVAGITLWENVYLRNGTFHVISSNAQSLPEPGFILCAHPNPDDSRPPAGTDRWTVSGREQALRTLGKDAVVLKGNTFFHNDEGSPNVNSFLGHYYHYCALNILPTPLHTNPTVDILVAEVFLAAWRVVTSTYGAGESELPSRILFRVEPSDWQDGAGLNTWLFRAILPKTQVEDAKIWEERIASGKTYMFEKLVIIDRFAAHQYGGPNVTKWNTMTMDITKLETPQEWMVPLIDALAGYVDCMEKKRDLPVVTYMNRQKTGRRLRDEDAESLAVELTKMAERGEIILHNQFFEDISAREQFCLILETDILLGVHGNGLTHMMWMKPSSAVIEIMGEPGFAMVYPWLAKVTGHEYHAVHYDRVYPEQDWTRPDGSPVSQEGDFHSDHIRVSGPFIAKLIADLASSRRL